VALKGVAADRGTFCMAFAFARRDPGFSRVAQTALVIVLGLALGNLLFNAIASAAGAGYPYTSFLFRPLDRFGDFFKLTFSYPGAPSHPAASYWGMDDLLARHSADVKRFEGTDVNHFHVPPIPTLLALAARRLMSLVDPVLLFLGFVTAALTALFSTVLRASPAGRTGVAFATVALLGYPTLLAIDRGHFFSLICAILMIGATLRTLRDGPSDGWAILMFAVALNIRPNAGVIPLALFLGRAGLSFRSAMLVGAASLGLFVGGLALAHQVYPAYTFDSFLAGLRDYGKDYAGGDIGYPNGSSLYGMLRAPFGYGAWMLAPPFFVGGLLLAAAILEARQGVLRPAECLFVTLCAYVLGSHVFADYHLLVFIIPLVLVAREKGPLDRSGWAIALASGLMLAPKNFIFVVHDNIAWSWQVIANPVILLLASGAVLVTARRRHLAANSGSEMLPAAAA
jgi:hypothetical protein